MEKAGGSLPPAFSDILYLLLLIVQTSDTGEYLAFEQFKRSAAAGGDVAHLVGKTELLDGCRGIAAADNGRAFAVNFS